MGTIQKRVYFYELKLYRDEGFTAQGQPILKHVNPTDVFSYISNLALDTNVHPNVYYPLPNSNALYMLVDSVSFPIKIRFILLRRKGLPYLAKANGQLDKLDLNELGADGLCEVTHMVLFKQYDEANNITRYILGAEVNGHGARHTRIRDYLSNKANHITNYVELRYIIKRDVIRMLNSTSGLKLIDISVTGPLRYLLELWDSDVNFNDILENDPVWRSEIRLTPRPRKLFGDEAVNFVRRLIDKIFSDQNHKERVNKFVVKLDDGTQIDIMEPHVVGDVAVVQHDDMYRVVDTADMYQKIINLYETLIRQGEI